MFDGVRTRFSWLLPILKPEYVVGRIISAIEKNRRRLIMPRFMYTSWLTRLLPVAWYDVLMDFFGVTHSMDEFHGGGE
jgi:all-trans-retinol dehydrogenase (NAD+)